ncbi:hypothetical protein KP509_10G089200 [Ceratopteris richardii]|uniref:Reverse transcriptase Ty1/copia-type domain-containing protein n=1 Tax=Ceratopteris richardii TaxID=49495 RepID=A0A8T2U392_CERRI|nr:hypothetical protein KP509_10G089200 [Ceratopteris richardii]
MREEFKISDLGSLTYFLGLEVVYKDHGLFLTQRKYIKDMLAKFKMQDCKIAGTPMEVNHKLSSHEGELIEDITSYQSLVGSLNYATLTRVDICYNVSVLSQFMHTPRKPHMDAAKRILKYLKGTINEGLYYPYVSVLGLKLFSDADWAGSKEDRRSTSGYLTFADSKLISWSSKKQPTIALSSTEAEYRGLAIATQEAMWMKTLFKDLGLEFGTPTIFGDNMSSIHLAANPIFHARTKHIEVHYHYVREKVLSKEIQISSVSTHKQCADILTKALDGTKLCKFKAMIGL